MLIGGAVDSTSVPGRRVRPPDRPRRTPRVVVPVGRANGDDFLEGRRVGNRRFSVTRGRVVFEEAIVSGRRHEEDSALVGVRYRVREHVDPSGLPKLRFATSHP